jgi:hypothetical protein
MTAMCRRFDSSPMLREQQFNQAAVLWPYGRHLAKTSAQASRGRSSVQPMLSDVCQHVRVQRSNGVAAERQRSAHGGRRHVSQPRGRHQRHLRYAAPRSVRVRVVATLPHAPGDSWWCQAGARRRAPARRCARAAGTRRCASTSPRAGRQMRPRLRAQAALASASQPHVAQKTAAHPLPSSNARPDARRTARRPRPRCPRAPARRRRRRRQPSAPRRRSAVSVASA